MSRGPKNEAPGRPTSDFEETTPHTLASFVGSDGTAPEDTVTTRWTKSDAEPIEKTQRIAAATPGAPVPPPLPALPVTRDTTIDGLPSIDVPRINAREDMTHTLPLPGAASARVVEDEPREPTETVHVTPHLASELEPDDARASVTPDLATKLEPDETPASVPSDRTSEPRSRRLDRRLKLLWLSVFAVVGTIALVLLLVLKTVLDMRGGAHRDAASQAASASASAAETTTAAPVASDLQAAPALSVSASAPAPAPAPAHAAPAPITVDASVAAPAAGGGAGPAIEAEVGAVLANSGPYRRRVWIDGKLVGETPGPFRVKCGKRRVKVGSDGQEQSIDVVCGAETIVK